MKKILSAFVFLTVFSIVGVNAQIFVPRPPVVYIPQLDPVRMQILNQVNRNMINGGARKGAAASTKGRPATAADYTLFKPRQENYLPKVLAQTVKGSANEQRKAEQFFESQIEMYEKTAAYWQYPAPDVAFALDYFISNNYEIYYDLIDVPRDKDPWVKRAKGSFDELAQLNFKKSMKVTPEQDRGIFFQMKNMLSANPEFKKLTDEDKQKMTESLAITYGVLQAGYLKAIDDEDERAIEQAHQTAKENIEKLIGVPIEKIKFSFNGLKIQ